MAANSNSDSASYNEKNQNTKTNGGPDVRKAAPASIPKRGSWRRWLALRSRTPPAIPIEAKLSTERSSNLLSQMVFWWMNPIMSVGYNRPLVLADIPKLPPTRRSEINSEKIAVQFKARVARGSKRPLLGALNSVYFKEFWFAGFCQLVATVLMTLSPLMLKLIIQYATDAYFGDNAPMGRGIGLAFGVIAMQLVGSVMINQTLFHGMMTGGMARAGLISMIYSKSQLISSRAKVGGVQGPDKDEIAADGKKRSRKSGNNDGQDGWSNGKVTNLMSTDTYRIDAAAMWFHILWTTPVQLAVILVQLIINLGPSALAGFALFVAMMPLLAYAMKSLARRRGAINKITDQRISLTEEILQGVRFVKYFAWETSFLEKLKLLRDAEIKGIQTLLGIRSAITAVALCVPIFASIIAFVTFSVTHSGLNTANIFASLSLFNTLRMPLNMFPVILAQSIDAHVSLGRIQSYLLAEEDIETRVIDRDQVDALKMEDASFTWETAGNQTEDKASKVPSGKVSRSRKQEASAVDVESAKTFDAEKTTGEADSVPFHFDGLNISIKRDELVAVVGSVGCGKTSLLAAFAGDMRMTSGSVTQGTTMAYCPQYSWIQNATVRENIVFGREFSQSLYDRVVEACALKIDFDMLPQGDLTEVGERGITLSGGQKQRLNIARSIYFDAEIILLDDPLSAVDAHVGHHIFSEAICGMLKGKCRVLATHQLHVLSRCDRIIWLQNGKVEAFATYEELIATQLGFRQMMSMTAKEKKSAGIDAEESYDTEDEEKIGLERLEKKMSSRKKELTSVPVALMGLEEKAENGVSWSVYNAYIAASGSRLTGPFVFIMCALAVSGNIVSTYWLGYWTAGTYGLTNATYIGVYAGLGGAQMVLLFLFAFSLTIGGTNSSKKLLGDAMKGTLRAPMSFFDTTPLGRIVNRFSKDVDVLDNFLTEAIRMYLMTLLTIISIFVLIIVEFPVFAAALGPLAFIFYFSAAYYRATARELKRQEALTRSFVFSRFSEAISGTATIRAYGITKQYREKLHATIDNMDACYFLTFSAQTWLSLRLDLTGNLLALVTAILIVTNRFNVSPSISAVVLTYVLQAVGLMQFMVKQLAEVENSMNSTERLLHYGRELPSEVEAPGTKVIEPDESWPTKGEIKFERVQMRYRSGLPLVLKGLDLNVRGGERIGVVGRTGAGKSSIMSCLFRLVELNEGRILIDDIDISKVGLHNLRSKLSIIPQDPTLFRGTVRSNLDPFSKYTDLELWNALRSANLVDELSPASEASSEDVTLLQQSSVSKITLETDVQAEGLNFSLGQRQLMALSRALIRKSRIIVCDEATSSIDEETDRKIQSTMLEGFRGSTLLCIAHRIKTIVNYDRVVVMDGGRVVECDTPLKLWEMGGIFRGICDKSKIRRADFDN